jgi:RimJ/RimL family protein N-acetyltransferase
MQLPASERWRNQTVELFMLEPALVSEAYVGWLNDPAVNRFLESRFVSHDLASTRAFVQQALADPNTLFFGIRSRASARHVGNIKLGPIDRRHGLGEIGILIGARDVWGQGIAPAAIDCLCDIARAELGLRKLTAGCYASNVGSARAFEKAGFIIEARRPAHLLLDGRPEDLVLLARQLTEETK